MQHLEPTPESGRRFFGSAIQGEVIMLNLLRFREWADYSMHPELAPPTRISGATAFERYIHHAQPFLHATGGQLLMLGKASHFLIGPFDERWDLVMLVKQKNKEALLSMASDKEFMAGIGHRTAALEDSRLLPMVNMDSNLINASRP
jgi:uncharacterized protein (DUF1330 family)